jgi:hypothetical protein
MNIQLKIKVRNVKYVILWDGIGPNVNEMDKGGSIWLMYFIYLYENRTMKAVEIIFK